MNNSINQTLSEIGDNSINGLQQASNSIDQQILIFLSNLLTWVLQALGLNIEVTPQIVSVLLLIFTIIIIYLKLKTLAELFKGWLGFLVVLVVVYLIAKIVGLI